MTSARRGFSRRASGVAAASVFAVIRFVQIKYDGLAVAPGEFFLVENRIGDDVFFAGPISQVAPTAALAAKRKIRVNRGVGLNFADGAFVFHGTGRFFGLRV